MPRAFTEKVLVKLLFDRDPRLTQLADKVAARDYVRAKPGSAMNLTSLYGVIDEPWRIRDLDLPDRFVIKPSHLSHAIKIVKKGDPVDRADLEALATLWLCTNCGVDHGEWAYRDIHRESCSKNFSMSMVTRPSTTSSTASMESPVGLTLIRGRLWSDLRCDVYDTDLRVLPVEVYDPRSATPQADAPPDFDRMLTVAATISAGIDQVRVDLYNVAGRILFGELTRYPNAGLIKFDPPIWDATFDGYWSSPDYRRRHGQRSSLRSA